MDKKTQALTPDPNARYYSDLILCCIPVLLMSMFFYGLRPLLLGIVAMVTGNLIDRLMAVLRDREYDPHEHSSECFALVLALLMPASVPYYVVVVAVLAADLLGKEVFGGVGCYPFHPVAVGYAIACANWPGLMFQYPQPMNWLPLFDMSSVALSDSADMALRNGGLPTMGNLNLLLGNFTGPLGTTCVVVILACGLLLLLRRHLDLVSSFSFLAACAVFVWLFPRLGGVSFGWPWQDITLRATMLRYELITNPLLFTAVFLLSEPVTRPKARASRVIFGAGLGILTMLLYYHGSRETGVAFALLIMNSLSSWLDRAVMLFMAKKEVRRLENR